MSYATDEVEDSAAEPPSRKARGFGENAKKYLY
jgi:hypothetical protein